MACQVQPPIAAIADLACGADLVVASRRGDNEAVDLFPDPGELVLATGGPLLVQPPAAEPLQARNVVIGRKNTRESRRVVADALPLLKSAASVRVFRFVRDRPGTAECGLEAVVDRLRRHEVPRSARSASARRGRWRTTCWPRPLNATQT